MTSDHGNVATDLRGAGRLLVDATTGLTDLVEAMHAAISPAVPAARKKEAQTGGVTGLVYRSVRGVTRAVGAGVDGLLGQLGPLLKADDPSPSREAVLAALNGVLGDHLAASANPLAIAMSLRSDGAALSLAKDDLRAAIPAATGKIVVLIHGLAMNDLQWRRQGSDFGAALARDLGFTPVFAHYNSGLHVSTNGRALAALVEQLVALWPVAVEDLTIVAHSMGGLVARSAHFYGAAAGLTWPGRLRRLVFLGTPHHGAPLERGGNALDFVIGLTPYSAPFARLGKIRSAGITDLRYGNLLDQDWEGRDRFARSRDERRPVPLPAGVDCYAIAAVTGENPDALGNRLLGDGLVPVDSALGRHRNPRRTLAFPADHQWIGRGMKHLDLQTRPEVYERIRGWLSREGVPRSSLRAPAVARRAPS
jgi:pimeloyl-ACP methyl ester carboxylesterase